MCLEIIYEAAIYLLINVHILTKSFSNAKIYPCNCEECRETHILLRGRIERFSDSALISFI